MYLQQIKKKKKRMQWTFDDDDDDAGDVEMCLDSTSTTTIAITTSLKKKKKKEKTRLQPPVLLMNQRLSIIEKVPFSGIMDRVSEQQKRERKEKNRKRRKKRKKRISRAKEKNLMMTTTATINNKKKPVKKKLPKRSLNGDSSDSDEAIERLEKRSRPKDAKRRKIIITVSTTTKNGVPPPPKKPAVTTPKKSNSKKKRPRTVPGFLPIKDDGYAGFGPDLVSTIPEAVVAYDSQRKQALTPFTVTTTPSEEEKKNPKRAENPAELINIVQAIDFERMTSTIGGVPIRMPAKTILAHFAKNRRESLVKRRLQAAEGLANQIDADITGNTTTTTTTASIKIKKEKPAAAAAKKVTKKSTAKKKPPKTVLDTPLDEFQAFFLLGRNLYTKLEVALRQVRAVEMVQNDGYPDFAQRASIATDLIAEQEFRDRTYRDPMAELAVEMMLSKRKQEGRQKEDANLDVSDSISLAINTLKLQSLGAGCTRIYCAQFLREPLWDERPCVNGDLCIGMNLPLMCPEITSTTKTEACIILREFYTPDEMSEYHRTGHWPDEEHRRCCLLCSRFRITKAFFSYHARGVSPEDTWIKVAQVQDHWNVVGEGEGYTPDETLQILSSKTGNWELSPYPVVMLNPSNLRAATMEIQPHQGRMVAIIEGTKKRIEISVPADHPLHSQYFYHEGEDLTLKEGLKKHIVGCFVEKGQDFQSASATSGQQSC